MKERDALKKELTKAELIRRVTQLAFGKPNDAVKLLFLDEDNRELVNKLNLSMVTEVKKSSNGTVEIKLLNRMELFRLLADLIKADSRMEADTREFFMAMDKAAARLNETENEI